MLKTLCAPVILLLASLAFSGAALAQSTTFTYQGELKQGGNVANGLLDLRFSLFDAASGGVQVGTTQCVNNVLVSDGKFTTTLDFGQQFVTTASRFLQIEVRQDSGLSCSNTTGFTILSTRQLLTATPLANHAKSAFALDAADGSPANAVFVDNAGNVGIGTSSPSSLLHAFGNRPELRLQDDDLAGSFAQIDDPSAGQMRVNKVSTATISLIDINPQIANGFGDAAVRFFRETNTSGIRRVIFHSGNNSAATSAEIGVGGRNSYFQLDGGNLGIGTASPTANLDVAGTLAATNIGSQSISTNSVFSTRTSPGASIIGVHSVEGSTAILGQISIPSLTAATAIMGNSGCSTANCFGVFANGRLGATGTKSFRIDHPDSPTTHYLFHYSTESPEAINFYRGRAILDETGRAVVILPSYFAKINTDPSYQLTAIGAPMPSLHVSVKISDDSLRLGERAGVGVAAPVCWFEIGGGAPRGEVSWRVEAVRNDEFVRHNGAPVEVAKPAHEVGTTQDSLYFRSQNP